MFEKNPSRSCYVTGRAKIGQKMEAEKGLQVPDKEKRSGRKGIEEWK
jgi:hypothetical protein